MIQDAFIELPQARLHYQEAGEGPALVFVHAAIADLTMWDDQFTEFSRDHRVVRYDMRGFGQSTGEGAFSSRDDLLVVMDALNLERASLVGCSMGGMTVIDFAVSHPERTAALVPVDAGLSGFAFEGAPPPEYAQMQQAEKEGDLDMAAEFATRIWIDSRHRTPEQVDPALRARAKGLARKALDNPVNYQLHMPLQPPAIERLDALTMPVLVMVGSYDGPMLQKIADLLASKIPGAQKVVFEGAAHLPNLEQPAEFNWALRNFLETHGV